MIQPFQQELARYAKTSKAMLWEKPDGYILRSRRISPYFFNAAFLMFDSEGVSKTGNAYANLILPFVQQIDFLHGPAYKGIPLVAVTVDSLHKMGHNLRFGFDIKEKEEHEPISVEDILRGAGGNIEDVLELPQLHYSGEGFQVLDDYVDKFRRQEIDLVFGESYSGIVPASILLKRLFERDRRNLRWAYNRKAPKGYADEPGSLIVGEVKKGDRALVVKSVEPTGPIVGNLRNGDRVGLVDDVITTGDTKKQAWDGLNQYRSGLIPVRVFLTMDRQERGGTAEQVTDKSAAQELAGLGLPVETILVAVPTFAWYRQEGLMPEDVHRRILAYYTRYGIKLP